MIRDATDADIAESVEIGIEFAQKSWYGTMRIDPQKMRNMAAHAIESPDWLYIVKIAEDGKQAGFFSAYLDTSMFGPDLIAIQHLMYIKPEYRKGTTAIKFFKIFEEWGRANKCHNLYFGATAFPDIDFGPFTERLGFGKVGGSWAKKL